MTVSPLFTFGFAWSPMRYVRTAIHVNEWRLERNAPSVHKALLGLSKVPRPVSCGRIMPQEDKQVLKATTLWRRDPL